MGYFVYLTFNILSTVVAIEMFFQALWNWIFMCALHVQSIVCVLENNTESNWGESRSPL